VLIAKAREAARCELHCRERRCGDGGREQENAALGLRKLAALQHAQRAKVPPRHVAVQTAVSRGRKEESSSERNRQWQSATNGRSPCTRSIAARPGQAEKSECRAHRRAAKQRQKICQDRGQTGGDPSCDGRRRRRANRQTAESQRRDCRDEEKSGKTTGAPQ